MELLAQLLKLIILRNADLILIILNFAATAVLNALRAYKILFFLKRRIP